MSAAVLSSKIVKGGSLIGDARRFAQCWDPLLSAAENRAQILDANLLAKTSRIRAEEVIGGALIPRFVAPGPHVLAALQRLLEDPNGFSTACYYEATRTDQLLAAFVEGPVWRWWNTGHLSLRAGDVLGWLAERIARGLLATLRDFGVLRGQRKEISVPNLEMSGFAYVAWREQEQGASARRLLRSPIWRRWLLDEERVRAHFGDLARTGVIHFAQTGSAVRLDWMVKALEELADAVA
jgi:hypothetical protein